MHPTFQTLDLPDESVNSLNILAILASTSESFPSIYASHFEKLAVKL